MKSNRLCRTKAFIKVSDKSTNVSRGLCKISKKSRRGINSITDKGLNGLIKRIIRMHEQNRLRVLRNMGEDSVDDIRTIVNINYNLKRGGKVFRGSKKFRFNHRRLDHRSSKERG